MAAAQIDFPAYAARIGYKGSGEPTLETLRVLHRLHPAAIPFEAIDCLLDRRISLDPAAVDAKLIGARRGGYCFEHNSLFARVLTTLGFQVQGLAGRVRWGLAEGMPVRPRTHQVLRVELDGASWLVDVGFGGCVLTAPMQLTPDTQTMDHDTYRLTPAEGGVTLEVRRDAGWLAAWELSFDPCQPADYEMANWYTSTFPTSHFRHDLLAAITKDHARYGLLHNVLTTRPRDAAPTRQVLNASGIRDALHDIFGLTPEPAWEPVIARAAARPAG